jgi:hypothetical protein
VFFRGGFGMTAKTNNKLCLSIDFDITRMSFYSHNGIERELENIISKIIEETESLIDLYIIEPSFFVAYGLESMLQKQLFKLKKKFPGFKSVFNGKRVGNNVEINNFAAEAYERYRADGAVISCFISRGGLNSFLKYKNKLLFVYISQESIKDTCSLILTEDYNVEPIFLNIIENQLFSELNIPLIIDTTNTNDISQLLRQNNRQLLFYAPNNTLSFSKVFFSDTGKFKADQSKLILHNEIFYEGDRFDLDNLQDRVRAHSMNVNLNNNSFEN